MRLTQSQSFLSAFLRQPRASVSGRCNSPARAALAWLPDIHVGWTQHPPRGSHVPCSAA